MMGIRNLVFGFALASTFGSAAAYAQSCPPSALSQSVELNFTTVAGQTLVLPAINSMECAEIDKMLARIDSTRYRGNGPQPHDAADCPLLNYELLLAEENYNRCVVVQKKVTGGLLIIKRSKSQ